MLVRNRLAGVMAAGLVVLLTGCSGFFPPVDNSGGGDNGGGSGTSTSGDFVYVANSTQTLAGFSVGTGSSGAPTLTAVTGSPYSLSAPPTAMAVTPGNSFLYVAETGGIYVYAINSSTGVLTAANSGGAVAVMVYPSLSLAVSPDGQWLFALSADNATIQEYKIDATAGTLAIQQPANYLISSGATVSPKMVKVTPNAAFVIAALGTAGEVVFPFNTTTGAFGSGFQPVAGSATSSDNALAIDSGTTFVYIARSGASSGVAAYAIAANGAFTPVAGSPFASGGGPFSVLLDSTGKYLYAGNRTDGTISGYAVGTGGTLTALTGSPYASGGGVNFLARDSSGKYVLASAAAGSPDLTMYSFDTATAGALDSAATVATGTDPAQPVMVVATH